MVAMLEGQEWVVIAVVALLLFGGSKLPELARSIGQAKSEFDKAVRGEKPPTPTEVESAVPTPDAAPPADVAATADVAPAAEVAAEEDRGEHRPDASGG